MRLGLLNVRAERLPMHQLLFQLLYSTDMRKTEALRLRAKDFDFDRRLIPSALEEDLRRQLHYARTLWKSD